MKTKCNLHYNLQYKNLLIHTTPVYYPLSLTKNAFSMKINIMNTIEIKAIEIRNLALVIFLNLFIHLFLFNIHKVNTWVIFVSASDLDSHFALNKPFKLTF